MIRPGIRSIIVNSRYLAAARLSAQGTRLIFIILAARILGPELYGLFVFGQSVYLALMATTALGIGRLLAMEVGKNRSHAEKLVGQALSLRTVAALLASIACAATGWLGDGDAVERGLLAVFAVALFGRVIATFCEDVYVAFESAYHATRQEALFRSAELVVSVLVLLLGGRVLGLACVHAASWVLQAIWGLHLVNRYFVPVHLMFERAVLFALLLRGLPIGVAAFLGSWLLQGPVILFRYSNPDADAVGQFGLAMQGLLILITLTSGFVIASLPVLSRSVDRGDGKEALFLDAVSRGGWLGGAAIGLTGFVFGPTVVDWLFGTDYAVAGHLLGPVLLLFGPLIVGMAASTVLFARGLHWDAAVHALIACLLLCLFLPLSSPRFGLDGAVCATGAAVGTWAIGLLFHLAHRGMCSLRLALLLPVATAAAAVAGFFIAIPVMDIVAALGLALLVLVIGGFLLLTTKERSLLRYRLNG